MKKPLVFIPYPQTPASAKEYIRAHGLCVADMAKQIGVGRFAFTDLLRGQGVGRRGNSYMAAVALGLKKSVRSNGGSQ